MWLPRRLADFNSRPSARGDFRACLAARTTPYFNSRPSARGDRLRVFDHVAHTHFNSRPSARGDGGRLALRVVLISFQFTPLREGRPYSPIFASVVSNFNSRPSARGDTLGFPIFCRGLISIHAPPRGATHSPSRCRPPRRISIHAPPRGATCSGSGRTTCCNFNSRPSARGDFALVWLRERHLISIHAPPRGATPPNQRHFRAFCNFNSRPSARGDPQRQKMQSGCANFNSRPSARGDHDAHRRGLVGTISIHAPPRGATRRNPA